MDKQKQHQFNYKGYVVVIAPNPEGGDNLIYPVHKTYDLNDEVPSCPSVESCLQWIDEDIRCREKKLPKVEMFPNGYEWVCLSCGGYNISKEVQVVHCRALSCEGKFRGVLGGQE